MAGNYEGVEDSILGRLLGKGTQELAPEVDSFAQSKPVAELSSAIPAGTPDPYNEALAAAANEHVPAAPSLDSQVTVPSGEGTAQGDFSEKYVPREQTVEPTRSKIKMEETPVSPEAPRESKEPNEADEMSRMEDEGQAGADYTAQAEKILPNGTPKEKESMAKWLAKRAAVAAGIGAAAYVGNSMLNGGKTPPAPAGKVIPPREQTPNVPTHIKSDEEMGIIPAHHVTSGVKPIAPEVATPGEENGNVAPKVSTLEEAPPESINNVHGLQDAQQRQNNAVFTNQIGRAADLIGAGFAGHGATPVAQDLFNSQIKEAGSITDNYEKLAEKEKDDPKSQISQDFRDYITKMTGQAPPAGMSATTGMKIMPYAMQKFLASDAQKARHEDLKYKYDALAADKAAKRQASAEAAAQKRTDAEEKAFTEASNKSLSYRSNPEVRQASADALSAKKALALVEGKDLNKLSSQDISLLTGEVAKMAQGGVPTDHGTQSVLPHTLIGKAQEWVSFFANHPTPAEAGEYIKHNIGYLKDMQRISADTLNKFHEATIKGYEHRLPPERYAELRKNFALETGVDDGSPKPQSNRPPTIQKDKDSRDIPAADDNGAPGIVTQDQPKYNQQAQVPGKVVVKKGYNAKTDQTQFLYSDGTKEIVQGRQ